MTTDNMRGPGALTTADATKKFGLGAKWTDETNGKRYMYCYNAGATSWTIGVPVGVFLTADAIGECSFTDATQLLADSGTTAATVVAGIALGTVATTEYGWIQVGGICDYLITDTNITASLSMYVADNGVTAIPGIDTSTHANFGTAIDADVAAVCGKSLLNNCFFDY